MPGAFVQAKMTLSAQRSLTIPSNALLFRKEGTRVAALDAAGTVRLKPVRLGRNFGDTVEVQDGLKGDEQLVLNPSDSLAEGDKVKIATDAPKAKPPCRRKARREASAVPGAARRSASLPVPIRASAGAVDLVFRVSVADALSTTGIGNSLRVEARGPHGGKVRRTMQLRAGRGGCSSMILN